MIGVIKDSLYVLNKSNIKLGADFYYLQLLVIVSSFFELFGLAILIPYIQYIIYGDGMLVEVFGYFNLSILNISNLSLSAFVACVYLFGTLLSLYAINKLLFFAHETSGKISFHLYKHILSESLSVFQQRNKASIVKNLTQEVDRVTESLFIPIVQINSKLILATSLFLTLLYTNVSLTLMLLSLFFTVYSVVILYSKNKLKFLSKKISDTNANRYSLINSMIFGFKEIKVYKIENYFENKYANETLSYNQSRASAQYMGGMAKYFIEFVIVIFFIVLAIFGWLNDGGALILLAVSMMKLLPALQVIYGSYSTIKANENSIKVLKDIIDKEEVLYKSTVIKPGLVVNSDYSVELQGVSLTLSDNEVLKDISLVVNKGEKVALIGKSGSGKSSLLSIILGLYDDYTGGVCSSGNISYVPQDIFINHGGVRDNIILDLPYDKNKFLDVISICQLEELVYREDITCASNLSGGQKQRIGIARALYRNPQILILDEATSALDYLTENKIIERIYSMGVTIIAVAHRFQSIKNSDVIYVLDCGKVIKSGKYEDLINSSGELTLMPLS